MFKKDSLTSFSQNPLLLLAFFFSLGILTANFFNFNWTISLSVSLFFAILTVICIKKNYSSVFLIICFLFLGAFTLQISNISQSESQVKNLFDLGILSADKPVEIEGVLQRNPEFAGDGFFLHLRIEKIFIKNEEQEISGNIRLFASIRDDLNKSEYENYDLKYGSRLKIACRLNREEKFQNQGAISFEEIYKQQNIDAVSSVKSSLLVEKIGETETFAPISWIFKQRETLITEFIDKFSVSTAGIMIASLLGNKYFLDKETAELFREGGTFHVLVISGLHITFIGGLTLLLIRFFTKKRLWQFVFAVGFLWIYSFAVGAEIPVVRAAIMFTILLFSQVVYRDGRLLNSLGLCVLILLVWRPNDLFSASFQLTFASVLAIIAMAFPLIENLRKIGTWTPTTENPFPPNVSEKLKRFCEMLYWREEVWEVEQNRQIWSANLFKFPYLKRMQNNGLRSVCAYLFEGILVSLIVQLWLLPFAVIYFHRVSIASIWLNLWVGFFIALESFAAIIALLLAQFSEILSLPIIKLTEILNYLLLFLPKIFVENDWASFRLPAYTGKASLIYGLYFLPIIVGTFWLYLWKPFELRQTHHQKKFRILKLLLTSIFISLFSIIIFHPFSAPKIDGKLHVDFIDVGQGDSALITFPNGETMLVDGGGKMNFNKNYVRSENSNEPEIFEPDAQRIGEAVVSELLWEKGYSKIDYILATHADTDHIQGLSDVAKNFRINTAFFGRMPDKDEDFAELSAILKRKNIESVMLSRGDFFNIGNVKIETLFPEKDDSLKNISDNNNSLVFRLIFGNKRFLFTGDIEKETEAKLLETPAFLQADFIKVPHHGSRTSSTAEFINATKAEYAIIPVGKRSQFGHPHKEVVERWKSSGAKVLTTGERGTISIVTDGKNLEIQTFKP